MWQGCKSHAYAEESHVAAQVAAASSALVINLIIRDGSDTCFQMLQDTNH